MNNAEKYKEQIFKVLMETGHNIAINKETDEPMSCKSGTCTNCKFFNFDNYSCYQARKEWLNEEHNPYTIPLDTPVDTKVLVSNDGEEWFKRYFSHFRKSEYELKPYICFDIGTTSWSASVSGFCEWRYCKLWEGDENEQTN